MLILPQQYSAYPVPSSIEGGSFIQGGSKHGLLHVIHIPYCVYSLTFKRKASYLHICQCREYNSQFINRGSNKTIFCNKCCFGYDFGTVLKTLCKFTSNYTSNFNFNYISDAIISCVCLYVRMMEIMITCSIVFKAQALGYLYVLINEYRLKIMCHLTMPL